MADSRFEIDLLKIEHAGERPQNEFYHSMAFLPAYLGGVGIGKTLVLVADFFDFAMACKGSRQMLTEPTYPMIRDILIPTIEDAYGHWEGERFEMTRQAPVDIKFANGSEIRCRSTDVHPERLYGGNWARVGMDEVTLGHQQEAYNILLQRLRQPGYHHQLKVTGTPKGMTWVHEEYVKRSRRDVEVHFAETMDAERGGTLPRGYVARLLESYGGWDSPLARQELAGAFLRMAGPVFPQFSRTDHIAPLDSAEAWRLLQQRTGGIDFGGVSPTALIAAGLDATGRVRAYAEWYKHEATIDDLVGAMADMQREAGISKWAADPAGAKEIQKLRNSGFNVLPAQHGNKIKLRVQLVGARLKKHGGRPGLLITNGCPNLVTELESLPWKRAKIPGKAEEQLNDEFERGAPDHAFDALANIISMIDGMREPVKREREPVRVYEEY